MRERARPRRARRTRTARAGSSAARESITHLCGRATEQHEARGRARHELPDRFSPPALSHPVGDPATRTPCGPEEPSPEPDEPALRPRRLAWAELLRRVFAVDVLECPRCGGRMRLLAAIQPPDVTQAILDCLELPSRAPPAAPAVPDVEEWSGDFDTSF